MKGEGEKRSGREGRGKEVKEKGGKERAAEEVSLLERKSWLRPALVTNLQ